MLLSAPIMREIYMTRNVYAALYQFGVRKIRKLKIGVPFFIRYNLNIPMWSKLLARNAEDINYLTSEAIWNITDFGAKCEKYETINTITLEKGELKKQV
jgi:hypothetical protein